MIAALPLSQCLSDNNTVSTKIKLTALLLPDVL